MSRRFAVGVVAAVVTAATFVLGVGAAYGDGQGGGLEVACSHESPAEHNPNCDSERSGDDRQGQVPPNETGAPPEEKLAACLEAAIAAQSPEGCDTSDTEGDDEEGDGWPAAFDNCPDTANADQADADGDNIGDACDPYPNDADHDGAADDADGDGVPDHLDNCPEDKNKKQEDADEDGDGDVCDDSDDGDPVPDDVEVAVNTAIDNIQAEL